MSDLKLDKLTTESRNLNTSNIDKVSTLEMVKIINNEDKKVAEAVEKEIPKIAQAIDYIVERIKKGGRLIYIGAGTSGRLGILDASECPPTYGVSEELIQGIIAGGREAIFRAKEGAEDSKELAIEDLKLKKLSSNDIVVGIADIIAFDKVHSPGGVKLQKRVIVGLAFWCILHAVHIRIPAADGTWVGDLICGYIRPFDRGVQMGGNPRDAPHDMDAEFQSQAVDVFGQRREAFSAGGGREAFRIRQQTGKFVCFQCGKRNILELCSLGACAVGVPLNVNHDIFPAVFLQMRRHVLRIAAYLRFVDCGVVVIVAVPAHRRVFGKIVFVHNRFLL